VQIFPLSPFIGWSFARSPSARDQLAGGGADSKFINELLRATKEELAVRHQYVIAHSRVLDMPREILASTRAQGVTSTSLEGEGMAKTGGREPACKSPPEAVWGIRRASSWKEKQCTLPECTRHRDHNPAWGGRHG
jgi:hypothetical protein